MKKKEKMNLPEWAVVALKALVYVAGLLLAGIGTTSCARMVGIL